MGKFKDNVEIVGIAAVVISLGFVAYEIRQNNELMAAEARQVRTGMVLSLIHISEPTRPPLLSRMPSSA